MDSPEDRHADQSPSPIPEALQFHTDDTSGTETQSSETEGAEEDLRAQLRESEKRALRLQAELENFRRRKSRETLEQVKFATLPLVTSLLEVIDNLQRALQAAESAEGQPQTQSLRQGVEMVESQLATVLENAGCKKIETTGQPFDPNLHEAIQMQPSDEIPPNHIVMEVQTGYLLHDRVARPSKVMVSTGPSK